MKKQNAYTINDSIFLDVLELIHDYFDLMPYAVVGGGAVQVYVYSTIMKKNIIPLQDHTSHFSFIFRKTGDIDLSFHYDMGSLIEILNRIIQNSTGSYTFHSFTKRFVIQKKNQRLNLNYQTEPEDLKGIPAYYNDIIQTAIDVYIPYNNKEIKIKIAKPEYLIASKLTRIKPKDQIDIMMLIKAMELNDYPFDSEEVRAILKSVNKGDNYSILAELIDSV